MMIAGWPAFISYRLSPAAADTYNKSEGPALRTRRSRGQSPSQSCSKIPKFPGPIFQGIGPIRHVSWPWCGGRREGTGGEIDPPYRVRETLPAGHIAITVTGGSTPGIAGRLTTAGQNLPGLETSLTRIASTLAKFSRHQTNGPSADKKGPCTAPAWGETLNLVGH